MRATSKRFLFICMLCICLSILAACRRDQVTQPAAAGPAAPAAPAEPAAEAPIPGDETRTLNFGGLERTYVVHMPPGLEAATPVPLVLAFHGIGLDSAEMMRISGLSATADSNGFIVVYPEGTGKAQSWNGGHCCGEAAAKNVDDIGFVRALVGELSKSLPVDPQRVYVTGFSNGAFLAYRAACELADLVAAAGPVSATPILDDMQTCSPSRPVPVIHFHGTADEPNPYNGGEMPSGFKVMSAEETMVFWAQKNGCPAEPASETTGSIRHDTWSPCTGGADIELYTINGGMHAWPGGKAVNAKMGEPTTEIQASALMWDFFARHPMP